MRPRSVVAIGFALTFAGLVAPAVAQDQDGYRHGRLRYVDPGVTLQRATDAGAEEAEGNEPLLPGDRVWTDASGRAEFQFPDGSLVRLDRRSKLDYSGHEEEGEERIVLRLWSGSVMVHAGSRNAARLEIETPGGTVTALQGSVVRVDVDGGEARVSVYSGEGRLDDGRTRLRLASGERTFSRWGEAAQEPERFDTYERDEFVSWDEGRESEVRAADASPYLPGELAIYSDEFDRNGDWRNESGVGYVWVPQVEAGWQPYSNGHWAWTAYGWTWIPNERWGWAPFHYGRWDYAASLGWYWVPGRTWGPAWVSWAVGGGYVGWCPLGRHDRPVVAWGDNGAGRYDRLDRGHAVPRGRLGGGFDAWSVVRNGELGRRDVAQRRVAIDRIDPAVVRVAGSAALRPTRDGTALRQGDAVPRAVSTRQRPGDFVRELGVDNKTTIPAPWTRGYGPPPAGVEGARYGVPRSTDGDRREAVGSVPAGRTGEAATSAPAGRTTGAAAPSGRPVPWFRPADEAQRSAGGAATTAGSGNAGARSATSGSRGSAPRDDGAVRRRDEATSNQRSGGSSAEPRRDAGESRPRHEGAAFGGSSRPSGGESQGARPAGGGEVRSYGGGSRSSGGSEAHPSGGAVPRSSGGARSSGGSSSSGGHAAPRPRKD